MYKLYINKMHVLSFILVYSGYHLLHFMCEIGKELAICHASP